MDKYDKHIKKLTKNPQWITMDWFAATGLFKFAGKHKGAGCLTMIRKNVGFTAPTNKLTSAILKDRRIPTQSALIKVKHLPVFAEWQRKIDAVLVKLKKGAKTRGSIRHSH